jgi:lysozyme
MNKLRAFAAATAVSVAGLSAIVLHEGKVNSAYPDPAHGWAVPTICIGHTATAKRGQWLSDDECLDLLKQDAAEAAGHVLRLSKVPLSQGELDAYTSFVFNVGAGAFARSTLLKELNAGNRVAACNQLTRWTYAGGQQLPGLVTRRKEERALCLRNIQSPRNATATS